MDLLDSVAVQQVTSGADDIVIGASVLDDDSVMLALTPKAWRILQGLLGTGGCAGVERVSDIDAFDRAFDDVCTRLAA